MKKYSDKLKEYVRDYAKEYKKSREPKQRNDNILRKRARRRMKCKPNDGMEVDHIKPLSKGGSNGDNNFSGTNYFMGDGEFSGDGEIIYTGVQGEYCGFCEDLANEDFEEFRRVFSDHFPVTVEVRVLPDDD